MIDTINFTSQSPLIINDTNLIWLDMEMTGLNFYSDRIIEIAIVITNSMLDKIVEGPVLVIYQNDNVLSRMNKWNRNTHSRSGLIDKVRASKTTELIASKKIIKFLKKYVVFGKSPMCGSSICQDRRFISHWMPDLEKFFHYRNLDVSTLKELCRRWNPNVYKNFQKRVMHTALSDVYGSIRELKYYRKYFFCRIV